MGSFDRNIFNMKIYHMKYSRYTVYYTCTVHSINAIYAHLCIELYEEEEDDILPLMLYGQVEGVLRMSLEHVIEKRGTQLSKVTRVEVTLGRVCVCVW